MVAWKRRPEDVSGVVSAASGALLGGTLLVAVVLAAAGLKARASPIPTRTPGPSHK
jgi:hypothetical protein